MTHVLVALFAQTVQTGRSYEFPPDVAKSLSHVPAVGFAPDGRRLFAVTDTGDLIVWDSAGRRLEHRVKLSNDPLACVSVDPKAELVVFATKPGLLCVMRLGDKKPRVLEESVKAAALTITPGAKTLGIAQGGKLEIRSMDGYALVKELPLAEQITGMAWSPAGDRMALVTGGGTLAVYSTKDFAQERQVKKPSPLYAVGFSPDGAKVAFGGQQNTVFELNLADGKEEVIAKGQPYWITSLAYSPDGSLIAFGDESCDIWIFRVKDKVQVFHGKHHNECWLNSVAWSPDGGIFLFGCRPNSHAGKPAIWTANGYAEAQQAPEVQRIAEDVAKRQQALDKLCDGRESLKAARAKLNELRAKRDQLLAKQQKAIKIVGFKALEEPGRELTFGDEGVQLADEEIARVSGAEGRKLGEEIQNLRKQLEADPDAKALLLAIGELEKKQQQEIQKKAQEYNACPRLNIWECIKK